MQRLHLLGERVESVVLSRKSRRFRVRAEQILGIKRAIVVQAVIGLIMTQQAVPRVLVVGYVYPNGLEQINVANVQDDNPGQTSQNGQHPNEQDDERAFVFCELALERVDDDDEAFERSRDHRERVQVYGQGAQEREQLAHDVKVDPFAVGFVYEVKRRAQRVEEIGDCDVGEEKVGDYAHASPLDEHDENDDVADERQDGD